MVISWQHYQLLVAVNKIKKKKCHLEEMLYNKVAHTLIIEQQTQ